MSALTRSRACWLIVVVFAIAMAWLESATVYYLRVLVGRLDPYQPNPLPIHGALGSVELVREAATLVMLLTVGMLAGRTWPTRLGYSAIAFGVWDIFYYVFLKVIYDWPKSLFDWDILFLLPLPWWGPVLAPMSHSGADDRVGHARQPAERAAARLSRVDVGAGLDRNRPRAVHVHGRRDSRRASGRRRDEDGLADDIQVVGVRRGARAHGRARRAHDTRLS